MIITGATTAQVWCACSKLEQKDKRGNITSSSFPMRVHPTSHFYKDCTGHKVARIQAVSFPACVGKETEQGGPKLTQPVTTTPQCLQPGVKYRLTLPGSAVTLWVFSLQHDGMSRSCYPPPTHSSTEERKCPFHITSVQTGNLCCPVTGMQRCYTSAADERVYMLMGLLLISSPPYLVIWEDPNFSNEL